MTKSEIDQRHLEFAVGDAKIWFRNIPKLTRSYVFQRLLDSITTQFRGHELTITSLSLHEVNPKTFTAKVNLSSCITLELDKEVSDD